MLTVYGLKCVEYFVNGQPCKSVKYIFEYRKKCKTFTHDILCRAFVSPDVEFCLSRDPASRRTLTFCLSYGSFHENMFLLICFLNLYHIPFYFSSSERDEDRVRRFGSTDTKALETLHLILFCFYPAQICLVFRISCLKTAMKCNLPFHVNVNFKDI